uniref:DNA mismatch repair protein MutL n=1 Tax=Cyanothece sp. (strain PCC 7425 / ATCC 29141) TaxID=395961 RepID=B8HSN8_CYAP4
MLTIRPLPTDLVHLIAAGEVIDSLVAVVRELVENALDAKATRIVITLCPEAWGIQVADNGCGMALADLQQAAAPHTTSKITRLEDLNQIRTLGFRGQALHSLAQLGQLEICSRSSQDAEGWRVTYNNRGEVEQLQAIALSIGTTVTVNALFAAWPGRRQSLPPLAVQLRAVQTLISQMALCHPQVTWQVFQTKTQMGANLPNRVNGAQRPWFSLAAAKSAKDILLQVLPMLQPGDVGELHQDHLELLIGLPERVHRHRPDWIQLAVNGRCVNICTREGQPADVQPLTSLEQTILQAFHRTLPRHRFPICFVHFKVPPDQVDWNRHPGKTEIYLDQLEFWQRQLQSALSQALGMTVNATLAEPARQFLKAAEAEGSYHLSRSLQSVSANPEPLPAGWMALRAVAQVHQMYILAEHPTGLWLVEQHIAHERVLYEQLLQHWQIVDLETPLILNQLSPAQVERLEQLNLEIEPFGVDLWAVRSAPALLAQRQDCGAALLELSLGEDLNAAIVATACRSAIRNGTPLSLEEMQNLLEQWQRTHHPRTCPHGRPIYLPLEETTLSRYFRRHWVIGKSHGV